MKVSNLILLGIVSFGGAVLWKMPASFAYQYAPHGNLQAQGVSGTIWNGEAKQVTLKKIKLDNVSWTIDPVKSLMSLGLISQIKIQDPDLSMNGRAGINFNQTISLENTQIEASGTFISRLQKLAKIKGAIKANITQLELEKGQLPRLDATLQWKQGELIAPIRVRPAGDYSIIVTPNDNGLNAKISSQQAPLILSGDVNIGNDWKYKTNIKIKAATAANKGIMNMLKMVVGKLERDGSAIIKEQGQLKPFY